MVIIMLLQKLGLIYFTQNGKALADRIQELPLENLEIIIYDKAVTSLECFVGEGFKTLNGIIFIGACGIAVRSIAPFISSKDKDPAIVVIDELGKYIIPILSGHIGGANELAQRLADMLNALPIITTATDLNGKFAVDLWASKNKGVIADISKIKHISSALLKGEKVGVYSDFYISGKLPDNVVMDNTLPLGFAVSLNETKTPFDITLNVIPKIVSIGVGCKRDTETNKFEEFILNILKENYISIKAVKRIASIDLKANEQCIIDFSKKYNIEFETFDAKILEQVEGEFKSSEFVLQTTGVGNVCERSALCNMKDSNLLINRQTESGMTAAVAVENWRCGF